MPGPHRGHLRPGHGAISMPHLPGAHHNPAGRGVTIAALVSCQPTPGLDGSAAPWGHSQVFHPSNPGKEEIKLGNPLTFKVIRVFLPYDDRSFSDCIWYKRKHRKSLIKSNHLFLSLICDLAASASTTELQDMLPRLAIRGVNRCPSH